MASVPREERAFVASAADALGYDEQRQPTSKQQLAIAAALAILDGRWRHHAESRQVGLAVAAYGVDQKQVNVFLDKLRALHSGSTAWKPYHDCITALEKRLHVEGQSRSAQLASARVVLHAHAHP